MIEGLKLRVSIVFFGGGGVGEGGVLDLLLG